MNSSEIDNKMEFETVQYMLTPSNSIYGSTGFGNTGTNPTWQIKTLLNGVYDILITSLQFGATGTTSDIVLQLKCGQISQLKTGSQSPSVLFTPYSTNIPFQKYNWKVKAQQINNVLDFSLHDFLNNNTGIPIFLNMTYLLITIDFRKH